MSTLKRKEPTTFIYGLKDPRDGAVWYIGKSNNPKSRLHQHTVDRVSNPYKIAWLSSLRQIGKHPQLVILEEVPESEWAAAENHWISYGYCHGWPLTNIIGYYPNGGIVVNLDDELDEVMFGYLSSDNWNRFCNLGADTKKSIVRAVAMETFPFTVLAKKAMGDNSTRYCPGEGYERAVYIAKLLVTTNQLSRELETIEKAAVILADKISSYVEANLVKRIQ